MTQTPTPLSMDAAQIEAVARALAVADGKDPDAHAWVRFPGAHPYGVCWRDQYAKKAEAAIAALSQAPNDQVEEEAYEIGKREGYADAMQELDEATGGDGEYCYCTNHDPERHCPDARTMKARVVDRLASQRRALECVVKGWEALPGGQRHSAKSVQSWLTGPMAEAVSNARAALSTNQVAIPDVEAVDEQDLAWLRAKLHDFNTAGNHAMQRRIERIIAALAMPQGGKVREAREILSGLSSYLGAGLGDDATTLAQFDDRIRWGIDHIGAVYRQRAAEVVEECSKRPGTTWGRVKRAILEDTCLPTAQANRAALTSEQSR